MMEYWQQITAYPSLLIGPTVLAAIVAAMISLVTSARNRTATSADVDRKIEAERQSADRRLIHERDHVISDRAWIDYGLRRDIYLDLAANIDALIQPGDAARHREFMIATRKVRLIGSDDVVLALNALTDSIKEDGGDANRSRCYSALFNAIRRDIRTLNEKPPVGTLLEESAFPIES
jgi:hypothetical protein